MFRSKLLFLVFLFYFNAGQNAVSAQITWFEPLDEWYIGHCVVQPDIFFNYVKHDSYSVIQCVEDTLINGIPCKKFIEESYQGMLWPDSPFFMYEEGGKVYWYNPGLEDFEMLYDINWEPGAEIELTSLMELDESCNLTLLHIDSVDYEWFGGLERRVLHASVEMDQNNFLYYVKIIEGIGKMDHPLTYYHCLFDVPGPGYVRCFHRVGEEVLSFTDFDCDYVTSITDQIISSTVQNLYPNPAANILSIELPQDQICTEYELLDIEGRIMSQVRNVNLSGPVHLELPVLTSGLYFISMKMIDGGLYTSKFVVQN
jgi:Secretion system C-terminal sorting domain